MKKMISYDEIVKKIYDEMIAVDNKGLKPYYLFMSIDVFHVLREELLKTELFQDGKIEFFEKMEIVPFSYVDKEYIEVKGINTVNVK